MGDERFFCGPPLFRYEPHLLSDSYESCRVQTPADVHDRVRTTVTVVDSSDRLPRLYTSIIYDDITWRKQQHML